ncbi:MAG: hypothetical protein JWR17_5188 [Pseudomonas sp.]|jgi:hypothetical protein|nr:hypothetical protein [Pseudomonas sp.]
MSDSPLVKKDATLLHHKPQYVIRSGLPAIRRLGGCDVCALYKVVYPTQFRLGEHS